MPAKKYRHLLTVHTGPMKAAKTLHLIQAYLHAQASRRTVQAFRPSVDTRHADPIICTRFGNVCIPASLVGSGADILAALKPETTLVLVDEVQFLESGFPATIREVLMQADVVVSGLDLDFRGLPFGPMAELLAMADTVHKYTTVCDACGGLARFSQRLIDGKPSRGEEKEVLPEGKQENVSYEARCHKCFQPPRSLTVTKQRRMKG
ncbi:MAG TPA: thymidine kinase [Verrucomicrobiae bacterium]|nr:thymidine kinase [Verrucomicrobiae bacterium]